MFYPFLLDSRVLLETLRLCEELDTTEQLHLHFSHSCIGEGNGNSLQCSCLENPRDGGAWWAAIYGIAQSRTRLKRLSSSWGSKLLCPGDFSGKNTGGACHLLLQGIFLTQGSHPHLQCLFHCRKILYPLSHQGTQKLYSETIIWM